MRAKKGCIFDRFFVLCFFWVGWLTDVDKFEKWLRLRERWRFYKGWLGAATGIDGVV